MNMFRDCSGFNFSDSGRNIPIFKKVYKKRLRCNKKKRRLKKDASKIAICDYRLRLVPAGINGA